MCPVIDKNHSNKGHVLTLTAFVWPLMADYDSDCDYNTRPETGRIRAAIELGRIVSRMIIGLFLVSITSVLSPASFL